MVISCGMLWVYTIFGLLPPGQVNMVFEHLTTTKAFSGHVIFLEEDHFLSPDFVEVTKKLVQLKNL